MKNILFVSVLILLSGCTEYKIVHDYRLEKYKNSEVPVCVDYSKRVEIVKSYDEKYFIDACGNRVETPEEYKDTDRLCDVFEPAVVSYGYCLARQSKPVVLVEKKKDDMTICYDRNNKVELPILYCQKDMINIQMTNVETSVTQNTNVLQKMIFNW